jgi:hypothetical protein
MQPDLLEMLKVWLSHYSGGAAGNLSFMRREV